MKTQNILLVGIFTFLLLAGLFTLLQVSAASAVASADLLLDPGGENWECVSVNHTSCFQNTETGALISIALPDSAAATSEFTVTKTADTFDGACDFDCSLREAIAAANATIGDDIIHLPSGVYNLTLDWWGAADDYGSLDITQEDYTTTVLGAGRDFTIIDATMLRTVGVNNPDRVFSIRYHAGLVLMDLTITGGYTENDLSTHRDGGGIWNWNGYLSMTNCLIEGNVAGDNGGGIANHYGTTKINNTIIRGNNTDPVGYHSNSYGGGIYNSGTMTITSSSIENNASNWGGGIASDYSLLENYVPAVTIIDSTIMSNTAQHGAGIANLESMADLPGREAAMIIANCEVINNNANRSQAGSGSFNEGGGIFNMGYSAAMTITDSTISGNLVTAFDALHPKDGSGGGVHNHGGRMEVQGTTISSNDAICDQMSPGDPDLCGRGGGVINTGAGRLNISNTTISGNETTLLNSSHEPYLGGGGGGGIAHMPYCDGSYCYCPLTTLFNTTITNNKADHGGGVNTRWESWGGGLYDIDEWEIEPHSHIYECAGLYTRNTIIADNSVTFTVGTADCWGSHSSYGHNLVGVDTGCSTDGTGDISTNNPTLGQLSNNGGDTETHPLLPVSPAIDAADPVDCPNTDQRGLARPIDGNRDGEAVCDIGSFEYQSKLVVDTLEDELNSDGDCSLREAINAAYDNNEVDACGSGDVFTDTITFSVSGTITLGEQLSVMAGGPLVIAGGEAITVSGNHSVRVLEVNPGGELTLNSLSVIHGDASDGGGIWNHGKLTIDNSVFESNSAVFEGGGILNHGTLTVKSSIFDGNSATWGGGILNSGSLTLITGTLSGNNAIERGGGIYNPGGELIVGNSTFDGNSSNEGGGIYTDTSGKTIIVESTFDGNSASDGGSILNHGILEITNSTLSGNSAEEYGGGIANSGTLTLTSSTLSVNNASAEGGGIYSSHGTLTLINSTLSANSADQGGSISNGGSAVLYNTIVADSPSGGNCLGTINDGGHNLEDVDTCGFDPANDSMSNLDPLLGDLEDNGGPTLTHALLSGSPAIDMADPAHCPETDQRGVPRPLDGDGDKVAICDIGSVEAPMVILLDFYLPLVSRE